ncbi:MAG TPA: hypothetical protein PLP86_05960 [Armatimonadota bacterium]|nr:hypothetical protein [Armatimonadota bacterium]
MKLDAFKQLVTSEFGQGLKHATPANVREFLDKIQQEVFQSRPGERIVLDETATTYEEVINDFFSRILDAPQDEAIVTLWTLALDLSFAAIEYQYAERFANLFHEFDEF